MSLFNWFRRKKRHNKKSNSVNLPSKNKLKKAKAEHKKATKKQFKVQHSRNNDPKLTKKERLKVDSDGNVTVPAERTYAYTTDEIKHNGYDPHKDLKRRKFLFAKHIVYNPIEANTKQMKRIRYLFVNSSQKISPKSYRISGRYIKPKAVESSSNSVASSSASLVSHKSSISTYNNSMVEKDSISQSSSSSYHSSEEPSYSDDTSEIISMVDTSDVSVNDLVKKLRQDTKRQLSMTNDASDTWNSDDSTESSQSSDNSVVSNEQPKSTSSKNFVVTSHTVSLDNQEIVDSLERSPSDGSSYSHASNSSNTSAFNWAESKIKEQQSLSHSFENTDKNMQSPDNSSSASNSVKDEPRYSYATESAFRSAVSSATLNASSAADDKRAESRNQISLNYTQKLESSYTSKSKANNQKLAEEKEHIDEQIEEYRKHEKASQQAERAQKSRQINSLDRDIKALEDSKAVLGGSEAKAKSASASRASSVSVARSVNAKISSNNTSNSIAMSAMASAYSVSASSYKSNISFYDKHIEDIAHKTANLKKTLNSVSNRASSANASLAVVKKQDRKHKALEIAYIRSYRDLMKDEAKKQREIRHNKKALAKARKKNQQLVVVSKNNTDVLKKVSRLNTNVRQANYQMNVYKGQVTKLRKAYLILKKKSSTALVDAKQARKNEQALETERAKNRKIRAVMHRLYDNNVKGQEKNRKLQKTIIKMHQSSIVTIKQLRHNIRNQEKLKYNKKLLQVTNNMIDANSTIFSDQPTNQFHADVSDERQANIKDNQLNKGHDKQESSVGGQHITINGFHPTHHSFTKAGRKSSDVKRSSPDKIPSRSRVHEHSSHNFLNGLFHHHDYDNNPSSYYTQNEVHSNQRIFLLRNVVQHSSKGLRTLKTGDKLYTTMLMPGPSGEDYKTNFLLRDGTSIPATKRTVKLID